MYKSLNTFIGNYKNCFAILSLLLTHFLLDDLFAFVIKMPTLHRLACLRDDFVFFVYLYQRHAYKTDHTRANEYGQVGEGSEKDAENEKEETKKNK
jgi:hypothetical protein